MGKIHKKQQGQHRGFISYIGGKSRLATKIIPRLAPHTCYVEVFAGGAWVLWRKPPSKCEVINDLNDRLIKLYRVVRAHPAEFLRYLRKHMVSRSEFERFLSLDVKHMTDIEMAVMHFYIIKTCYGARFFRPTFGVTRTGGPRLNLFSVKRDIVRVSKRLDSVTVENLPYQRCIEVYDTPETLFYIDPPYYGCEDYYGEGMFSREDFARLAMQLKGIKGKFLMSINDAAEIRELFAEFWIVEVDTN